MDDKVDRKDKLRSVLAKLSGVTDTASLRPSDIKAFPVTRIRRGLVPFTMYPDAESLMAARIDFKQVTADLFAWDDPKANKTVTKAAAQLIQHRLPDGTSGYSAAAEMLSLAAAAAPLLEPDRIARLIAHAEGTVLAYHPVVWPASLAAGLRRCLGKFAEPAREALLKSLWDVAHHPRWWEELHSEKPKVRRRRGDNDEPGSLREAMLEGRQYGMVSDDDVSVLRAARYTDAELKAMAELAANPHLDPEMQSRYAAVAAFSPAQRPPSPLQAIVDITATALDWVDEQGGDPTLPAKPMTWPELCPHGDTRPFPVPSHVLARFHGRPLPGFEGVEAGEPRSLVRVLRTQRELLANSDFMGNCTRGWVHRSEQGAEFIVHAHVRGLNHFNACLQARGGGRFTLGEINSRHNRREVPPEVEAGFEALLAEVNATAHAAA